MRWTKEERQAIEEQIKEYEKKIGNTRCKRWCVFCGDFYCSDCVNKKIDNILELHIDDSYCNTNKNYFVEKFHLSRSKRFKDFTQNMQQLKFRRQMWQDALDLTKREFVKKYKREG